MVLIHTRLSYIEKINKENENVKKGKKKVSPQRETGETDKKWSKRVKQKKMDKKKVKEGRRDVK